MSPPHRFTPRLVNAPEDEGPPTPRTEPPSFGSEEIGKRGDVSLLLETMARHVEHLDQQHDGVLEDLAEVKATQAAHGEQLSSIKAAVERIEKRVDKTERTAKDAAREAAQAGGADAAFVRDVARDALQGKRDRRQALWSAFGKASAWLFAGGGIIAIVGALARCG